MTFWQKCIASQNCGVIFQQNQKLTKIEQDEIRVSSGFSALQFERGKAKKIQSAIQQDKLVKKSENPHMRTSLKRKKRNTPLEKQGQNTCLKNVLCPNLIHCENRNHDRETFQEQLQTSQDKKTQDISDESITFSKQYETVQSHQSKTQLNEQDPTKSVAQVLMPSNRIHDQPLSRTVKRKPNVVAQKIILPLKKSELTEKKKNLKFLPQKYIFIQNNSRLNSQKKSGLGEVTVLENGKQLTIMNIRKAESIFDSDSDSQSSIVMNRFKTLYHSHLVSQNSYCDQKQGH